MLEEKVKKAENINKISSEAVAKLTESDIIKTTSASWATASAA